MKEHEFESLIKTILILADDEKSEALKCIADELRLYQEAILKSREFEASNIDIDKKSRKTYRMF